MATQEQVQRFWSHVDMSGDCWAWQLNIDPYGYGRSFWEGKAAQLAHRVAWRITHGDIPAGMHVMHSCDNRSCVNPAHLSLGTALDNHQDKAKKGRSRNGWQTMPDSMVRSKGPRIALTSSQVERIFALRSVALSQAQIGRMVGCKQTTVSQVLRLGTRTAQELVLSDGSHQ